MKPSGSSSPKMKLRPKANTVGNIWNVLQNSCPNYIATLFCGDKGFQHKTPIKIRIFKLKDSSSEGKSLILNYLDTLDINNTGVCIWYRSYIYALWKENISETDPRSYEATKAFAKKAQKEFWGINGIRSHDLRNTGVMIYQLSYEVLLVLD